MAAVEVQRAPTQLGIDGDPRADIIIQLKSRPYYIPTLKPPFKDWPDALSPHYPALKKSLDARINKYASTFIKPPPTKSLIKLSFQIGYTPLSAQLNSYGETMAFALACGGLVRL